MLGAAARGAARAEGDPETKAQQLRNSTLLHAVASHDAPQVRTAADAGRSGKRRRRRLRQQAAAAADRGAEASVSTDGAAVAPEDTESTKADGGQNDGKSDIDTSITKVEVHVAMATESAASEKDDGAMKIERMRLKKQRRKAARDAKRRKVQATGS